MKNLKNKYSLTIAWLYPDLMNTYGDQGNIIVFTKRCEKRGIKANVKELNVGFSEEELEGSDFIFMGGAQDRQQKIVADDLFNKSKTLKRLMDKEIPGLFICGAYQFLGKYYKEADGTIIKGLGIMDLYTESPGLNVKRLIGNVVVRTKDSMLIGFENHGGRTFLGKNIKPLGEVLVGYGNNGEDKTEGAIYKKCFGSYLHGSILPKNPQFTDLLIELALERKYNTKIELEKLNDDIENAARNSIARRLNVKV